MSFYLKIFLSSITIFLFFTPFLFAAEPITIELKPPSSFTAPLCPIPLWKNLSVIWEGVKDKRSVAEVGQIKKGDQQIPVVSKPDLSQIFEPAIKNVLISCGMTLVSKGDENTLHLSSQINEFEVKLDPKFFTTKRIAKSRLAFTATRPLQTINAEVGYEIESKKFWHSSEKQMKEILDELLVKTLEQIPLSKTLKELK